MNFGIRVNFKIYFSKFSDVKIIKMSQYILALDQGTTSCRAVVVDNQGAIIPVAQKEFEQLFPKPGWVEHDATEIWATQAGVAAEAVSKKGIKGEQIAAIGITNQRETVVVWDKNTI